MRGQEAIEQTSLAGMGRCASAALMHRGKLVPTGSPCRRWFNRATPVPVENSDSTILMMQSAKNRVGGNAAVELNCTRDWSILVQR